MGSPRETGQNGRNGGGVGHAGQGVSLARVGLTITSEAGSIHLAHCVTDPKGQFHCGEGTDLGTGPHKASLLVTHRDWAPVRLELGTITVPEEGDCISGEGPSDEAVGGTRGMPVESPCEVEVTEGGESFVEVRLKE